MNPVSLLLLGTLCILVYFWLRTLPPSKRGRAIILIVLVTLALFLLLMAVTGRLHWIAAVFAALLPFARRLFPIIIRLFPFLRFIYQNRQQKHQSSGNTSSIETATLDMTLDHDSGVMYGKIKQGPFSGMTLGDLSEQQFLELLNFCRNNDQQAARLLESYLDKRFGGSWRQDDNHAAESASDDSMSLDLAYQILGLKPGCSREEVISAHRKLMQKNHPDRGGSDYLAARINQAKDLILKSL